MSTEPSPPNPRDAARLADVSPEDESPKLLAAKSELEADDEEIADVRREERFLWALACLILFDIVVFREFQTWSGPLVIGLMELIFILVLAKRMGVEEIATMLASFIESGAGNHNRK